MNNLVVIPHEAQKRILDKIYDLMAADNINCALISSNANMYYLTGRVFSGYVLLMRGSNPIYLVKRPVHLTDSHVIYIRKPEDIREHLAEQSIPVPTNIALELNSLTYNAVKRLSKALGITELYDISRVLSVARATKTPYELEKLRISGLKHESVYRQIPALYQPGMTDIELQVEIEKLSRLEGCLGQFRVAGTEMELFMGNVLAGDNADSPSPFDFAMGGAGIDPSLPIGADGTIIKPGMAVMVDMNGNFGGYMTDMTRCFGLGNIKDTALKAHQLSIDICKTLADMGRPGVEAKSLYEKALSMAKEAGYEDYFMGHRQHAGFVGHGIGIEVNELPVLAPRSRDILQAGNVIAIEPKFVIPGVGAVGIENTYLVTENGPMECMTNAPEQLIKFD